LGNGIKLLGSSPGCSGGNWQKKKPLSSAASVRQWKILSTEKKGCSIMNQKKPSEEERPAFSSKGCVALSQKQSEKRGTTAESGRITKGLKKKRGKTNAPNKKQNEKKKKGTRPLTF